MPLTPTSHLAARVPRLTMPTPSVLRVGGCVPLSVWTTTGAGFRPRSLHTSSLTSARRASASSSSSSSFRLGPNLGSGSSSNWHGSSPSLAFTWANWANSTRAFPWTRALAAVGMVGAGAIALDALFNNTSAQPVSGDFDSIASNAYVREYLNETFRYVGGALTMTAASAYAVSRSYTMRRAMANSPIAFGIGGFVLTVGAMMGTLYTDPSNSAQKHALFAAFALSKGVMLSSLFFLNPAVLARAGFYTAGIVGSLSYIAATSKSDRYLYLGGPLFGGLCIVALSSLGTLFLPVTSAALPLLYSVSLYGGLALFGGFVLYDTQKVIQHGQRAAQGLVKRDPVNESVSLCLDFNSIFVRLVQILRMGGGNKKR
ncbi:inhibitor of apoptosis-promoting Bax1-domain-containing protein [Chytriomyces sp. MP71]|nr:inhibitor of apoptosis-promoting Bax1-domain-containing protein [Chytriomyces sp. MP71]